MCWKIAISLWNRDFNALVRLILMVEMYEVMEDIKEFLKQKSPGIKIQIFIWINKCLD